MKDKSSKVRIGIFLFCLGICFGLGFLAGKKSIPSIHFVQAPAGPTSIVTNVVTVIQKVPATENTPRSSAPEKWNDKDWQQWLAQAATPDRNAKLAALLEKLAAVDPTRAMALAQAEGNLSLRKDLVHAVLHGWARTAPMDAAAWVMTQPDSGERDTAIASVFAGAIATDPNAAVAVGQMVMQQYPGDAIGCGSRLIDALCDAGDFSAAANLAAGGSSSQRDSWLGEAFSKWASYQPAAAAQAAQAITDPQTRNEALHGIAGGWAETDPAGLVQFLGQLPSGNDRAQMLGQALKSWAQTDPDAAANWMNNHSNFGPDLDQGLAQVATIESLPTDVAVGWAESISDPQLRSATLASVARDWLYSDMPAAENYIQTTTNLSGADRQQLADVMAGIAGNSSTPNPQQ